MNITFRQLKLFLALVETGSVSHAARVMHVTQPTASMQLKEITQTVGIPLFEVISKKVHITEMGRELAHTARQIVQTWEAFEQNADRTKGLARGKLRVAVVSTAKYFMPRLIGSFCKKYPDIDVSLEILNRDGVVQRMRENLDDMYIMSQPPSDLDLNDEIFMANPLVLIAATRSIFMKQKNILLRHVENERFILREQGSGTRMGVDQHFKVHQFKPNIRMELGSHEAIKEAVAGGLGLGIVSRHSLHGQQKEHGVAVVDVKGFPILSNWHVVHPASKKLSPVANAFKLHMQSEIVRHK